MRNKRIRWQAAAAMLGLAVWVAATPASGDTWDANGAIPPNGIWGVNVNWADDTTPGVDDAVFFTIDDTYTVTFDADPEAIFFMQLSAGDITFVSSGGVRTLPVTSASGSRNALIGNGSTLTLGANGNPLHLTIGNTLGVHANDTTLNINAGSQVNTGNIALAQAGVGTGVINVNDGGSLAVDVGGSTDISTIGTINIDGGSVELGTLNTGGTINLTAGSLSYLGDLSVGPEGLLGTDLNLTTDRQVTLSGTTTLDPSHQLKLDGGSLSTGSLVVNGDFNFVRGTLEIPGGTITGLSNMTVPSQGVYRATGTQTLAVVGVAGSQVTAIGDLTLGDATKVNGFYSNGTFVVGDHNVALADANDAVFDSAALVTLGDTGSAGTLAAAKGLTLDFGGNITGFGTVDTPDDPFTPLINNGAITGDSLAEPITLPGYVKGVGTLDNVVITGTDVPGFSPATVYRGSVEYAGTLEIEIGGTSPGSFDRIIHSGLAELGGSLDVSVIDPFVLSPGLSFEIIDVGTSLTGQFDGLQEGGLVGNFGGVNLLITYAGGDGNDVELLSATPGDFDIDDDVDAIDFLKWQRGESPRPLTTADLADWEANYGAEPGTLVSNSMVVPEPSALFLLAIGSVLGQLLNTRREFLP